jgi:signal transduction histidine kinase
MTRPGFFCLALFVSVFNALPVLAQERAPAELFLETKTLDLDQNRLDAWLETREHRWTAQEILNSKSPELQGNSFGYRLEPAWIRIPVINRSDRLDWELLIHPRSLRNVDLYVFDSRGTQVKEAHYQLGTPATSGVLDRIVPTFDLQLKTHERYTLIAKIRALEPLGIDVEIANPAYSDRFYRQSDLLSSIYVGVLLALILYNFFIYRTLREKFFIPYLGLMVSLLFLVPNLNGIWDYLIPSRWPFSNWIAFFTATACLCGNEFCRAFLKLETFHPRLNRLQSGLSILCVIFAIQALPPFYTRFPWWVGTANDFLLISSVCLIFTCAAFSINTVPIRRSALYFLAPWLGFILSCALFIGVTQGVIPNNIWTRSIVEMCNLAEMFFLSYVISDRVSLIEQERATAVQKAWQAERFEHLFKMVCHDIANPLFVVLAHAQVAARGHAVNWNTVLRAVDEQQKILKFARQQGDDLQFSEEKLANQVTDLNEVIQTLRFMFERVAAEKGVKLQFPELQQNSGNFLVQAETVALTHGVLANALSNAIKFSRFGQEVKVILHEEQEQLILLVEDQGEGIPKTIRCQLQTGEQVTSTPGVRGELGTGYGFRLMQFFTKAFGGASMEWKSVSVEDGVGQTGTSLRFTFRRRLKRHSDQSNSWSIKS